MPVNEGRRSLKGAYSPWAIASYGTVPLLEKVSREGSTGRTLSSS